MGRFLLVINSATLIGGVFFITESDVRGALITGLLLFLPLLDRVKAGAYFTVFNHQTSIWLSIGLCYFLLLVNNPGYISTTLLSIIFTAFPEEWFFRGYCLRRLSLFYEKMWINNVLCSVFFALVHVPAQGVLGLMTFFPSLAFGYVFLKTKNLLLVVLLHALSNMLYLIYLRDWVSRIAP